MKKIFTLTLCVLLFSFSAMAGKLVFIPVNETQNLETLFSNHDLKIHYHCDDYVLATANEVVGYEKVVVLDENGFADGKEYAIVYCFENQKEEYLAKTKESGKLLHSGANFMVMQILSKEFGPAKNDGMIAIRDVQARLPNSRAAYPVVTEPDADLLNYLSQVSADSLISFIQTLQDFETRMCMHPNIFLVRDWLKGKYESFGLEVSIQNFPFQNNDNVIAIQRGTEFPDEYVVCGAHYDSFTYESYINYMYDNATGADDNASGTAGILETARILSQYDFKRSIIYCSFSAEELGLHGSGYFAEKCAQEKMNIVGYFNLDMIGFLKEGSSIHIDYIFPNSAKSLADYAINICNVYLPEVPIRQFTSLSWGDSDHTSFNKMGYRGVWPFEDINCDSPHIHHIPGVSGCSTPCLGSVPCLGDIIGPSVNNPEQVSVFTQATLACVATLAMYDQEMPPPSAPPTNCIAEPYNKTTIRIKWNAPAGEKPDGYYVYRDGVKLLQNLIPNLIYYDAKVNDNKVHCYSVKALYDAIFESDFSNESCTSLSNRITEFDTKFYIYPNPANNELRVTSYELQVTVVEIFDLLGKMQKAESRRQKDENEIIVDVSHLAPGIYFIKIDNRMVGKFVKE